MSLFLFLSLSVCLFLSLVYLCVCACYALNMNCLPLAYVLNVCYPAGIIIWGMGRDSGQ